jgi:BirA family biotin operon repressor/biotin-[acetyl-CoA-carboxylase] ligase
MFQQIGHTIIHIESLESTNNYAIRQVVVNEVEEGTVFLAYEQMAGRGQVNNQWESEAGMNLTFSILLRPSFLEIQKQFMLSKIVCLGLVSFLCRSVDPVKIKWPNDIYVGDRKICGVLIENAVMSGIISHSVVGIGLNINQTIFRLPAPNPVSLKMITGKDYDLDVAIKELLKEIDLYYMKLRSGQFEELDRAFHDKLYRLNEWHTYRDEIHIYSGKIIGVNPIGQLRIQEKDGPVHAYYLKEVEYLK